MKTSIIIALFLLSTFNCFSQISKKELKGDWGIYETLEDTSSVEGASFIWRFGETQDQIFLAMKNGEEPEAFGTATDYKIIDGKIQIFEDGETTIYIVSVINKNLLLLIEKGKDEGFYIQRIIPNISQK